MPFVSPQPITERQREVLALIHRSVRDRGYAPSLREIADELAIKSTNGVNDHLTALERKGLVRRDFKTSRALSLTEAGRTTIASREELLARRQTLVAELARIDAAIGGGA